jgi:pterin-4a-carbinolamine dehydratase
MCLFTVQTCLFHLDVRVVRTARSLEHHPKMGTMYRRIKVILDHIDGMRCEENEWKGTMRKSMAQADMWWYIAEYLL